MVAQEHTAKQNHSDKVDAFMSKLEHPLKTEIEALRKIILAANEGVREEIKWNAPSFYITEHFATFKLRPIQTVQIVFHTGAKVKKQSSAIAINDPSGLLEWVAKDRCLATFSDLHDVQAKQTSITDIVRQWIQQLLLYAPRSYRWQA